MRKTIISVGMSGFLIAMLAGCGTRTAQEDVRSVDWYESHETERTAKLKDCMTSPRTLDATPDCVNASRAENNIKAATKWATPDEGVRTEPSIRN
ncbi:hypothetical protein SAMN05216404_10643 [Nitrosospira multiformis]|uniref:Uncharacterized protein n=1 Tax=Nitrosospira multiformis TaxID=1231 RepID=A0A1H8IDG7_9PROT|nr:EexN family lipoprotein [Nitrosospira multiformis]SEN66331.1 hypothetical protein SAMN05216404_10643 [Nitrosospira multiformis]